MGPVKGSRRQVTPPPAVSCFNFLGMKQLMAGGGVAMIGLTIGPLLSGLFG